MGGVRFLPSDLTGLQLWLDANDASTLFQDAAKTTAAGDGDVVGAWADKSGQGNDATQATTAQKPTLQDGIINGRSIVRGDATDDVMEISVGPLTNVAIFVVAKRRVTNSLGYVLSNGGTSSFRLVFPTTLNSIINSYNSVGSQVTGGFVELNTNLYIAKYDGVNNILVVNNGTPDSNAVAALAHTWTNIFARNDTGTSTVDSDIAEMLIYNTALSDEDIALVETYLSAKWGITLS